ncbi:sugar phosphate isomerase/epimerase family protein [Arthrobacter gengyunqii]|uniref:Sugar phosphate isomerase/epimerase n=1 Tax=Arthrobacter gengyunqii TaxID=2886940 RepID=A0ABS8GDM9_9MICC|nr:sugar phosphate isomerase/epimerase [Arthrobacter gengyunqii]MCC3264721.1 sugar phosphate isomerase/epimerase [Arthrobacter gengyunqii]
MSEQHVIPTAVARASNLELSVQLYSVRDHVSKDLPGTLTRLADLGFRHVEPYNFVALAGDLRSALDATGLKAPSGHAPLLRENQHVIFEAAAALGISTVIEPLVPADQWATAEQVASTARALNAAAAIGAEHGIRVGYHNHEWELRTRLNGTTALEVLVEQLDPEVVLEVDTYWAAVGGEDPVALLDRLGDRVRLVHLKDGPISRDTAAQQPAGQGAMNTDAVVQAAVRNGVETGVIEFDAYSGDIFEALGSSLDYLEGGFVR